MSSKKRENVGIFPKLGYPLPQFGNPMFVRDFFFGYFAFYDIRNIFGFHKYFTFGVVLWFVEVGMGDPDSPTPLKRKIPTLSRFV